MAEVGGRAAGATFELERFTWETADQLAVTGTFTGLTDVPSETPVLVVHGDRATHRLAAVADRVAWPPEDGAPWTAAFAWSDPPAPFTTAQLELGDGRHVELPEPSARRPRFGRRVLALVGAQEAGDAPAAEGEDAGAVALAEAPAVEAEAEAPEAEAEAPAPDERVGLHADLVRAREAAVAAEARAQDADERLARAETDVQTERDRRAADTERFREALDAVQATADEALAAERTANAELGDGLRTAHAELDRLRAERDDLNGRVESAERAVGERQADAQRLRERLASIRNALSEDG